MGTKAVFAIAASDGSYYTNIIGTASDGFPENLQYLADRAMKCAIKLRVKTSFNKCNHVAVKRVMDALEAEHPDWLFQDNVRNAAWVSYSAILNPKTGTVRIYEGTFEYEIQRAGV